MSVSKLPPEPSGGDSRLPEPQDEYEYPPPRPWDLDPDRYLSEFEPELPSWADDESGTGSWTGDGEVWAAGFLFESVGVFDGQPIFFKPLVRHRRMHFRRLKRRG